MFVRLRWFVFGVVGTLGALAWLATKVKGAKQRLTPSNLGRAAAVAGAGLLEAAGRRLAAADRVEAGDGANLASP